MTTYNAPEQKYESENKGQVKAAVIPYAGVFLYLALGMVIVATFGFGWPQALAAMSGYDEYGYWVGNVVSMVIAFVGILILSCVIGMKAFSKKTSTMIVLFLLDAVCWGVAFSSVVDYACSYTAVFNGSFSDGYGIVGIAFGVIAAVMLIMGIIGFVFKNSWKLSVFIFVGLLGIVVLSLINVFLFGNSTVSWIIDMIFFAVIMIETIVDMNRIKRMAQGGWLGGNNNLTIYCAYTLMSDYVMLLIRIIPYLLMATGRRR